MNRNVEDLIINNTNLIYYSLKHLNLFSKENIDKYYDIGMIGLVKGAKKYNKSLGLKPSTYLTKCIINSILYEIRRENRSGRLNLNNTISLSTLVYENLELEEMVKSNINIEEEIIKSENNEELYKALNSLNNAEKFVIIYSYGLFEQETLKQDVMSKMLGIDRSSVSRIKTRAIVKMRRFLNGKDFKRK